MIFFITDITGIRGSIPVEAKIEEFVDAVDLYIYL